MAGMANGLIKDFLQLLQRVVGGFLQQLAQLDARYGKALADASGAGTG